ncbi:cell division protein FtsL [Neisseria weaveri]|uniref:Cell division protein FtsL n=1 Tax=Neisseria weaveri TaxID=28091 RepID=A0A3S5B4G9_9NEIS|nr:cell division protein FtsL [Neisseria weaveri]EGV35652.1 cell division protein FtsL [Neisseria weaveri ATCC 51223]EGV38302.1 cell division protein FtsL [Neisseria weaveri LMG 5135]SAY51688.1 cell division protein FtsL-related protein [Neisseria weaveri]VEJ50989.1 cell division protein FtsL-related protein [Neisseria weaveri]
MINKLNVVLLLVVFGSGLGVVSVQNQSRQYYIALDKAEKQEAHLDQEYARLKLEQAKLASHKLIKQAADRQNLHPPSAADTQIIEVR